MKQFLKNNYTYMLIALWAVACFVFFQYFYPYHFAFKEQNQLFLLHKGYWFSYLEHPYWLARVTGDFFTQFYYYLYAGAILLTLAILILGDLTRRALEGIRVPRHLAFWLAMLVMTLEAVFHFDIRYHLSSTVLKIMVAATVYFSVCLWRRWKPLMAVPPLLFVAACLPWRSLYPREMSEYTNTMSLGRLTAPDFMLERYLAVDNEYDRGNYDEVIRLVEESDSQPDAMLFFYNLAQAQKGHLPDNLMKYPSKNQLGTFYSIGPDTPSLIIRSMNELYWALGDMTFAERAAMMANVFSEDNRNVRMIKRLAEVNIVSCDTLAAKKYQRILEKTWCRRKWSWFAWGKKKYEEKRQYLNTSDTIQAGDNAYPIMARLLESNPKNSIALHYLLCSDLLLKDMDVFKRDYDRYCVEKNNIPGNKLYQEALCIYLAGTDAPQEDWDKYISSRDVMKRFAEYNSRRGDKRFRDTYWYYFDTHK